MREVPVESNISRSEDTNTLRACVGAVRSTTYENTGGITSQKQIEAYVGAVMGVWRAGGRTGAGCVARGSPWKPFVTGTLVLPL